MNFFALLVDKQPFVNDNVLRMIRKANSHLVRQEEEMHLLPPDQRSEYIKSLAGSYGLDSSQARIMVDAAEQFTFETFERERNTE